MGDSRTHRGPHPDDDRLFATQVVPMLRQAAADLCWLLSRGYTRKSALKLIGDRYDLLARQRVAVSRCTCSNNEAAQRRERQVQAADLTGRALWLDGYNVLTTVEAALAGGVILCSRDGTYRDMASMHGTYRKVAETRTALELLGEVIASLGVAESCWYLDRPVSNSGRLKSIMEEVAAAHDWRWTVQLVQNPDTVLSETDQIVATADSMILDRCAAWFNLARATIDRHVPAARVLEL